MDECSKLLVDAPGLTTMDTSAATGPSPLMQWCGGALGAFVDGFIDGLPIGGSGGAGIAMADGKFASKFELIPLLITAAHIVAIPFGTGLADVRAWKKNHPFPNIYEQSSLSEKLPPS